MGKIKDITGQKFGHLTAVKMAYRQHEKHGTRIFWECKCGCGNIVNVATSHLTTGHTKSCGCYHVENASKINYRHGMRNTRVYGIWCNIIKRCTDPQNEAYSNYGGRGIAVCDEWKEFINFYNDMQAGYSDDLTIDRIDNDKGYNKDNCRWATAEKQANNRRTNRYIEFEGETKTLAEWCRIKRMNYKTVFARLQKGWSFRDAISKPIDHNYHNVWNKK